MSKEFKDKEVAFPSNGETGTREKITAQEACGTKDFKDAELKMKAILFDYYEKNLSDIDSKPMEAIYTQNWNKIKIEKGLEANLKDCNPNFSRGKQWRTNCQRCVPTYEMRCRGYDVTALPKPNNPDRMDLSFQPFSVWQNPEVIHCSKNGLDDIEKKMQIWGDGARAQVAVVWKNTNSGHTFVAERVNGKTIYMDPQNGSMDVKKYFSLVKDDSVRLTRMDTLDVSYKILDCCRKV